MGPGPPWELHVCCTCFFFLIFGNCSWVSHTSQFQQDTCFAVTRTALLRQLQRRQKRKTWSHLMRLIRWARWESFIFTRRGEKAQYRPSWCAGFTAAHDYTIFPGKMLILLLRCLRVLLNVTNYSFDYGMSLPLKQGLGTFSRVG